MQTGTGRCRLEQEGVDWNRKVQTGTGKCLPEQEGLGRVRMHGIVLGRWTEESKERRREGSQETEVDSRGH